MTAVSLEAASYDYEIFDHHPCHLRHGIAGPLTLKQEPSSSRESKSEMPHTTALLGFALISFGLVLTPGPNMIYLISRSITQGTPAGIVSLGGVALGFVFYMLCAAFGITALLFAVPYAYDALRFAGAAYLLWLAWQAVKPGGRSPFQVRKLAADGPRKLFAMGFVTNLLNPKIAMLYLALLPQFIDPTAGSVLAQSLVLGAIQITMSISVHAMIALGAGRIALFLSRRPGWMLVQRYLMGTVLAGLAVRMAFEARRA
jgi:threonine/homoserine/homoserine lactone efflux protein